jgi:formate dehydrogenase iron-sulfur subunit
MSKAFFIDTSRCTACRGCQVACKEWHGHRAVPTKQTGTHQNPPELTPFNFKLVRFSEHKIDGRIQWLFFADQCRHCVSPPCKEMADNYVPGAVVIDEPTGAVLYTAKTKELTIDQAKEVREFCPYNIPRRDEDAGLVVKCDMCIDRVRANMPPACVKVCCTGAMNFGERAEMLKLAESRLETVKKTFPKAVVLDADSVNVIYLTTEDRKMYHQYAERGPAVFTRKRVLRKLASPIREMFG